MSRKWKKKLADFYGKHKIIGYILVCMAAFFIVVRKRREQRNCFYGQHQRRIAGWMAGVIAITSLFSPSSISLPDKIYAAQAGARLEWEEMDLNFGPLNVIFDEEGNMYLFDWSNGRIRKYDKTGNLVSGWNNFATKQLDIAGLCFDKNENLIVSNPGRGFSIVDKETGYRISQVDTQEGVCGCACDEEGYIYVALKNGAVSKYTSSGEMLWSVQANISRGLCIDDEGNIYSTNSVSGYIVKIKPEGVLDTEFGTNGKLVLAGRTTTSGKSIHGNLGDATFYDGNLYQCCYGAQMVIKISENGEVLEEVASGIGPRTFVRYNDKYIIINREGNTGQIRCIDAPTIDVQQEHFEFALNPTNIMEGSDETVNLSIQSNSTKNYKVKAKLYDKFTGAYITDVNSSTAQLQNGDANLTLTPSAVGWKKGVYEIRLEFSNTIGTMTLTDTINVNVVMGVGYYKVDYITENAHIDPMVEYIEKIEGKNDYTLTFHVIPDENYILEEISSTGGTVQRLGNDVTISEIQSDIQVNIQTREGQPDTTPPVISGVEDGGVYCGEQTITIWDEKLSKVMVDGRQVTLDENNQYVILPKEEKQTISAWDMQGNTTSIQIKVNDGHTFGEWVVELEPSCTQKGKKYHSCEICNTRENEDIEALVHDWEEDYREDKKPTWDTPGSKSIHCRRCDTIKEEKDIVPGQLGVMAASVEEAPKLEIITSTEELRDAVFTKEEQDRILYGEDAVITLKVKDVTDCVSEEDRELVQQEMGENTLGQYLDISLYKVIGNDEEIPVSTTKSGIKFSIEETNKPQDTQENRIGNSFLIRVHGNEAQILSDLDEEDGSITVESDKFSTYAIVYETIKQQIEEPTIEEPTIEEPTTQEPTTQEPTTQEPTTQEPQSLVQPTEPQVEETQPLVMQEETTTEAPKKKNTKKEKKEPAQPIVSKRKTPVKTAPSTGDEMPVSWLFIMEMIVGASVYMLCRKKRKKQRV